MRIFFAECVSSSRRRTHFDFPGLSSDASPRNGSILFFLKRKSTPAEPFSLTTRGALDDFAPVEIQSIERETELGRAVLHVMIQLGIFEERLGWYGPSCCRCRRSVLGLRRLPFCQAVPRG